MSEFKEYIDSILNGIVMDSKGRKDMEDEIEDHLKLLKQEFMIKGCSEKEAIEMAVKNFGSAKDIKAKYAFAFSRFNMIIRLSAAILFVPYILLFIKLSFFSYFSSLEPNSINLVPLKSISHYLFNYSSLNYNTWFNNLFGMVIAFIPFGFLIPIMHNRIRKLRDVIIASISFAALVEVLQYITKRGIADIDDIILSAIGSILGYILLTLIVKSASLIKKGLSSIKTAGN